MQQHYRIELVEEYDKVNFYSIHMDGKELTELESFFEKFPIGCEYDEDIDVIIAWMDKIISSRMSDGSVILVDKEIIGNLNFTRNEEE